METWGVLVKEKFKYLFKNTGLLFVSNFASKILVFLFVPFYTSILTTAEYGTYDLLYTTVQLLAPILSFNITDSIMRFSIGMKQEEQNKAFTVGVKYVGMSILLGLLGFFIFSNCFQAKEIGQYTVQFILLFAAYGLNNMILQFSRGIDDVFGIAMAGVIGTLAMIVFNLFLMLYLQMGLDGYFYAMTLSLIVPALYLVMRNRLWRYFVPEQFHWHACKHEREMLGYCLPLIFINLSWYINNVSDRYVVSWFCGIETNGIYSVSYKIPAILNAVQVVFIQAWQLSAIKEFNAVDRELFYRKTYQGCQIVMTTLCSGLIFGTRILAKALFAKEFYKAWIYVPILLIYIVFNVLSGAIGGVFSAAKDSKKLAVSGIAGAVVNIVLNFVLVYFYGAMGAAAATLISSVVIWGMRTRASVRYIKMKINYRGHIFQYVMLVVQAIMMVCVNDVCLAYAGQAIVFILIGLVNLKEMRSMKHENV